MKITKRQLRRIIKETLLTEQAKKEDIDFDPAELEGLNLTPALKKMLDPDITPAKYADLDAELDNSGSPNHQAIALAAFALSYADGDQAGTADLLKKALQALPKLIKAREAGKAKK